MSADVQQTVDSPQGGGPQLTEEHHSWMESFFGVSTRPPPAPDAASSAAPEKKEEKPRGFFDRVSDAASAVGDMASSAVHGVVDGAEKVVSVATDAAGKVLETAVDVQAKVEGAVVDAIPLPDSIKSAAHTAIDFQKGVGEGVIEGAKGAIKGVAHLAGAATKEVYDLATSEKAREEAATTVVHGAEAVGSFVETAVTDPSKAEDEVEGAVKGAADKVVQIGKAVYHSYEEAKAAGHGAEWIGKGVGQVGVAVAGAVLTDGASLAGEGAVVGAEVVTEGANLVRGAEALEEVAGLAKGAEALEDTAALAKGAESVEDGAGLAQKGSGAIKDAETLEEEGVSAGRTANTVKEGAAPADEEALASAGEREAGDVGTVADPAKAAPKRVKVGAGGEEAAEAEAEAASGAGSGGGGGGGGEGGGGGGEGAGGGEPPEDPLEGMSVDAKHPQHLKGPDGWEGRKLNGTHSATEAEKAIQTKYPGTKIVKEPTATPGIDEMKWEVKGQDGVTREASKTVYDPSVYSDERILEMGQDAAMDAWKNFLKNPKPGSQDIMSGGVKFRVYINPAPDGGAGFVVTNVHPIP